MLAKELLKIGPPISGEWMEFQLRKAAMAVNHH
jgi:hypothetical protein